MTDGVRGSRRRPDGARNGDRIDRVVTSGRRRLLVTRLLHVDQPIALTELARHVAAAEANCRTSVVPTSLLQSTYLNLRERHVPALEAAGIVEYEPEVGRVELAPLSEQERSRIDARLRQG